jgi:hypothetical protein
MAKRNYSKARKKIAPAAHSLFFKAPGVDENSIDTFWIDLSQAVSIANRRFYRQGLVWCVDNIKIMTQTVTDAGAPSPGVMPKGKVVVSKAPQTWILSNAWEKAFRHWQTMNKNSGGVPGKFHDFKVFLDVYHQQSSLARRLRPISLGVGLMGTDSIGSGKALAEPGDWDYSQVVVPEADNADPTGANAYDIVCVGDNYPNLGAGALPVVSLIQGYANSRAIGASAFLDPNVPGEMDEVSGDKPENWLDALTNEGIVQDAEVMDNLLEQNIQAPYPFENDNTGLNTSTHYPGGQEQLTGPQVHAIEPITASTIGGTTYIQGGTFPCGLLRFDFANYDTTATTKQENWIQIDLVPGEHRGYLVESMVEM